MQHCYLFVKIFIIFFDCEENYIYIFMIWEKWSMYSELEVQSKVQLVHHKQPHATSSEIQIWFSSTFEFVKVLVSRWKFCQIYDELIHQLNYGGWQKNNRKRRRQKKSNRVSRDKKEFSLGLVVLCHAFISRCRW